MGLCAVLALGLHRRSQATSEDQAMKAIGFETPTRTLTDARSHRGALASLGVPSSHRQHHAGGLG